MPDPNAPIVLLVGHCFPDAMMLQSSIKRLIPGVRFEKAHSIADMETHITGSALALVNRVLDGDFVDDDGISLIRRFAGNGTPLMLISNFPESQAEAESAGAAPGFGKTALYEEETAERIRAAIAG